MEWQELMSVQFEDAEFQSRVLEYGANRENEMPNKHSENTEIDEGLQEEDQGGKWQPHRARTHIQNKKF